MRERREDAIRVSSMVSINGARQRKAVVGAVRKEFDVFLIICWS